MRTGLEAILAMIAGGFAGSKLGELASHFPRIEAPTETAAEIRRRSPALGRAIRAFPVLAALAFLGGALLTVPLFFLRGTHPAVPIFLSFASVFLYPDLVRGAYELLLAITPVPPWNRLVPRNFLTSHPRLRHRGALRLAICLGALVSMQLLGRALASGS